MESVQQRGTYGAIWVDAVTGISEDDNRGGLVKSLHSIKEIEIYGDHVPQQKTANHREIAYSIENYYIYTTPNQCEKKQTFFFFIRSAKI